jgi:hypothetical protein
MKHSGCGGEILFTYTADNYVGLYLDQEGNTADFKERAPDCSIGTSLPPNP